MLKRLIQYRQGRPLAAVLLLLAAFALANLERTPLAPLRDILFDAYQRSFPRDRSDIPAVIVAIDEKSLAAHGQWPWPRTVVADLVERILAAEPQALGVDILFIEPDRDSRSELAKRLPMPSDWLRRLPEPDERLAAALAKGPTVLAAIGGERGAAPGDEGLAAPGFHTLIGSRSPLPLHAASQGLINGALPVTGNSEESGVVRRVPLVGRVGDRLVPSLGLEMVRVALDAPEITVDTGAQGIAQVGVGSYRLPTLANGELALHFAPFRRDRVFSAADVLAGRIPKEDFAGRFVLLGLTAVGLQDQVVTPLGGERIPGVDIHAQVIESLLSGKAAKRPGAMLAVELAALLAAGFLLIALLPRLRPVPAVAAAGGLVLLIPAAGFGAFAGGTWLFDGLDIALCLALPIAVLISSSLIEADERRRTAESQLQASREAAARLDGELGAARRIQMGLLPDPKAALAGDRRLEIAALLEPAKTVGGDYYDCFRLDENRIVIAVGDVSGKGIPASLFMSMAKTLTGALARRQDDLGAAVQEAGIELDRQNPEMLFVTAFVAVLDAGSGTLTYVCAGHDAPLLVRGGTAQRLEVAEASGPPLCTLPDFPYRSGQTQLEPGDLLCFFTDGITEASNGTAFYGGERLANFLARQEGAPADIAQALVADVRRFEEGQPPADDLTLLLARWNGPAVSGR